MLHRLVPTITFALVAGPAQAEAEASGEFVHWLASSLTGLGGALVGGFAVFLAAWLQGRTGRRVERDRLRHDVAVMIAERRVQAYVQLATMAGLCYRLKTRSDPDFEDRRNSWQNYFYDNRFYFTVELGESFTHLRNSMKAYPYKKDILEQNLNQFFAVVRDDLLITELAHSLGRAVIRR